MIIDDIALTMHPEVGPKTAIHLIECFGTVENIYAATQEQLIEIALLKKSIAKSIANKESHSRAEQEVEFITKNRIKAIASDSSLYPQRVKESCDYPHVIYVKGEIDLNRGHWISIVGTRKITSYGLKMCEQIVGELATMFPDLVVVSGLAYGVDVASHRAALSNNALTVGVLGHALTYIYPPQHTDVARRIVDSGGALISEFHSGARPNRSGFVQRNRIIAALSEGTLIVESASKGGSLITADMTDGYNRQVMAIPGRLGDPYSEGTNALIKNLKAEMVTSCRDIVAIMDWDIPTIPKKRESDKVQLELESNIGTGLQKSQQQVYSEHLEYQQLQEPQQGRSEHREPQGLAESLELTERREPQELTESSKHPELWLDGSQIGSLELERFQKQVQPRVSTIQSEIISATRSEAEATFQSEAQFPYSLKTQPKVQLGECPATQSEADIELESSVIKQEGAKIRVDMYQQSATAPSRQILDMINSESPISFDELVLNLGLKMPVLSALLLDLEFSGKIRVLPGKQYIRI